MKEWQELFAKAKALFAQANDMQSASDTIGVPLSEEKLTEMNAFLDEAEKVKAKGEILKAEDEIRTRLQAGVDFGTMLDQPAGRVSDPGNPDARVEVGDPAWMADEAMGYKSFKDFMVSIKDSTLQGKLTPQLCALHMEATVGGDEQSTFSDPFGGFLIPKGFLTTLLSIGTEADPTAGLATEIPTNVKMLEIPALVDEDHSSSVSGGLRVRRRAEADTQASSRMEFKKIMFNTTALQGVAYSTREILRDSPISVAALLQQGFNKEFGAKMLEEKIDGTGVGEFEGVLNSDALITVAKEDNQAADTISRTNVIDMRARAHNYGNMIWITNHDCFPQLAGMTLDVGTGGVPVYHFNLQDDRPDRLLGRPVFYSEFAKTIGDVGDLILADWSQYVVVTREGLNSETSIHVRFLEHEQTFKFWMENDAHSWWNNPLTPKNGSTLSPFITLAAR